MNIKTRQGQEKEQIGTGKHQDSLEQGRSFQVVPVETDVPRASELGVIGKPVPRIDGPMKVSGLQRYGADYYFPDMLFVKVVRSPHAHARVLGIDFSSAIKQPAVVSCISAEDIKGNNRTGLAGPHRPVLVPEGGNVHYIGDAVALVVARTAEQATDAARKVQVEYQPLKAVFDPAEALLPDAPQLQDHSQDNIVYTYDLEYGQPDEALEVAEHIVFSEFHVPSQEHVQLEPEAGVATIDQDGFITIYVASQDPMYVLRMVGESLGIPQSKLRVKALPAGGAFGGRAHIGVEVHLALAAQVTHHSVKLVWSREESILSSPKRHPAIIKYKMGGTKDGRIMVIDVDVITDSGAYETCSPWVLNVLCGGLPGPYDIPNIRVVGKAVATNNPISGAFRGYGDPQAFAVTEEMVDLFARETGNDPVQVRLASGHTQESTPTQHGVHIDHQVMLGEVVNQAMRIAGGKPESSSPSRKVGRGFATVLPLFDTAGAKWGPLAGTAASVEILPDGCVVVRCGVTELGVGITTVLAQIASEEMGVPMDEVGVVFGDSLTSPKAGPSVASRQAYAAGNAVRLACIQLRDRMVEIASRDLGVEREKILPTRGKFDVKGDPSKSISSRELAFSMYNTGINREAYVWWRPMHAEYGHVYVMAIVDLEVDLETGQIEILQVVNSHDIGRALNPLNVRGQLIGGGNQAIGWTIMENFVVEEGHVLSPSLVEYLTPTSLDIPGSYKTVLVEAPYPTGPYGAKGVGEHGMDAVPGAILNAIQDATGIMFTEWPVTSERLWRALQEKKL
jgi:CO/xanthine dehydrogenase Mo-binding subunit